VVIPSKIWASTALLFIATLTLAEPARSTRIPVTHATEVGNCTFSFTDSLAGKFTDDFDGPAPLTPSAVYEADLKRTTLPRTISIIFSCVPSGTNPVTACRNLIGVDQTSHGWLPWNGLVDGPPGKADQLKVTALRSINGTGAVRIENYTYTFQGDRAPHRRLGFCLISPNGTALYGGVTVDEFSGRHRSVEPEVMQLLRSIEFTGSSASPAKAVDR
jgi:hypothetical protein